MSLTKTILFFVCLVPLCAKAQHRTGDSTVLLKPAALSAKAIRITTPAYLKINDSTLYILHYNLGNCKLESISTGIIYLQNTLAIPTPEIVEEAAPPPPPSRNPLIVVHGDVMYDFFYRSAIDTPYADNNVMQHSVRANIYAVIKKTLPVTIQFNTRQSNSYLFKDYFDANLQFDGRSYQNLLKQNFKEKVTDYVQRQSNDSLLFKVLQQKQALQHQYAQWLQDGKQLQRLIDSRSALSQLGDYNELLNDPEEAIKEKAINYAKDSVTSLITGSDTLSSYKTWMDKGKNIKGQLNSKTLDANQAKTIAKEQLNEKQEDAKNFLKDYAKKSKKYDQLTEEIDEWEEKYKAAKKSTKQKIDSLKNEIDNADNPKELQEQLEKYGADTLKQFRWMKHLMAIKRFSIGRSMVDYSELTAKNISVTGINIEYNNKFYYAVSAGTVDYRYRDFIVNRVKKVPQYLLLARFGVGRSDKNHVIATIYHGKKQASFFDNSGNPTANKVLGVSIETRYNFDRDHFIIAEVAKSSYPANAVSTSGTSKPSHVFGFSDRSNEAYNIQVFSSINRTATRLYGQYKRQGVNFQSFNIFNYNANFHSWHIKADQYFFRRSLSIAASVKTNEYNSPFTIYNFKSNTILVSLQATLRLKKLPTITAAYMPATQLYKNDNEIIEARFSTLMASASHMYKLNQVYMHSSVVYNRFFNEKDQQQFVYYNAQNWLINHSIMLDRLTLNSAVSLSYSTNYKLKTYDQGVQYQIKQWLRLGGGLKWNTMTREAARLGYYANTQIKMKKLGALDLSFDCGFLPGFNGGFQSNNIGRVIYLKNF